MSYEIKKENGVITMKEEETVRDSRQIEKNYTVKTGDNLWLIAKTQLGDGKKYREIAELNGIANPDLIYPGQVLRLKE